MRRTLFLVLLCASSAFAQGQWGSLPVDLVIPMNTSTPGMTLTTAIANAGMVSNNCVPGGSGSTGCNFATFVPNQAVGANQNACSNLGQVTVNGGSQSYPAQSLNYNSIAVPDPSFNTSDIGNITFNSGIRPANVTVLYCLTLGMPGQANGNDYDTLWIQDGNGHGSIVQIGNGSGGSSGEMGVSIEANSPFTHSPAIRIQPYDGSPRDSTYFFSLNVVGGTAPGSCTVGAVGATGCSTLTVWNSYGTQLGQVVVPSTFSTLTNIRLPSNENGTDANTTYYQNVMVNWTAPPVAMFWTQTDLAAGILAPARDAQWSSAGVTGGIPSRTQCTNANCAALTSSSTASQIQTAFAGAPANSYVLLPAANYPFCLTLSGTSNVTLRGAGANSTIFAPTSSCGGAGINVTNSGSTNESSPATVSGVTVQGSNTLTLSTVSGLSVGSSIVIDQHDSTTDLGGLLILGSPSSYTGPFVAPGNAGPYSQDGESQNARCPGGTSAPATCFHQEHIAVVTGISGNNVTISPPLAMPNWLPGNTMSAWWATTPISGVGIEDLQVNMTGASGGDGIYLTWCANCWTKGVSVVDTNVAHVQVNWGTNDTINNSYFFLTQNHIVSSYGVVCNSCSHVLFENNIFHGVASPIIWNGTSSGNVVGYNYNINNYYTSSTGYSQNVIGEHSGGVDTNLYEGNESTNFVDADTIHGTGNLDTFFRDLITGTPPACYASGSTYATSTYAACNNPLAPYQIQSYHRFYNVIGNVLGTTEQNTTYLGNESFSSNDVYSVGLGGSAANDPNVLATLMLWGNCDSATGFTACRFNANEINAGTAFISLPTSQQVGYNPTPASHTLPASFYYKVKPSWWPAAKPWPIIGPDVTGGNISGVNGLAYTNPAADCYKTLGGLTNGSGGQLTSFNEATCYAGAPSAPILSIPTISGFGSISQGTLSGWQNVTISNVGTAAATLTSYTFTGTNSGDFLAYPAYNNPAVFSPSTAVAISTFIVDSNNCMETVTTAGTTGAMAPTWTSPTCVLGQATTSGSAVYSVIGTYPNGCGSTLAAGASCTIVVAFEPSTSGSESATLQVNFSGGGTSPATASVSGTGTTAFVSPNLPTAPTQVNLPLIMAHTAVNPYGAALNQALLAPATTYTVCSSGCNYTDANLQAALTQAFSDCQTNTSLVQLFNTESVPTTGLNVGNGTNGCASGKYVRFETNHPELLPPDGSRVNHSYAGVMPQLVVAAAGDYAIQLAHNMSGFEMRGIGFSNNASIVTQTQQTFRCSDELITASASVPTNVILDQNVLWAGGVTGNLSHTAIVSDCNNMAIINNDVENYQYTQGDNQAINGSCSSGPLLISNNTLSATTENTMMGGNGCGITDGGIGSNPFPVPSNIIFASNYYYKPLRWRMNNCGAATGTYCGTGFSWIDLTPQPTTASCTGTQCQVNVSFFASSQRPDIHPYDNAVLQNCANSLFNGTYAVLLSPLPTNSSNPFTFSVINTNLNSTNAPNGTTTTGCTLAGLFDPQWVPPADGSYVYDVKDIFELKLCNTCLVIGNWFMNTWQGGQEEMMIMQEANPIAATLNFAPWNLTGNVRVTGNVWDSADINGWGNTMWTALNAAVNGSGVGSSLGTVAPIELDNNLVYGIGPVFTYYEEWLSHGNSTGPLANGQLPDLFVNHNTILQNSVNTALGNFDLLQFASPSNLQPGQTPFLRDAVDNNIIDFGQLANETVSYPYGSQKCEINSGLAVPCLTPAAWAANIPLGTIAGSTAPYGCTNVNSTASFQPNAGPAGVGSSFCPTANLSAVGLSNTTINTASNPISPGINTVTPAAMTNISPGTVLFVGSSTNAEFVTAITTTGSTFTANFQNAHTSQITTVYGTSLPSGSIGHAAGTDGLDIGANAAAVIAMTSWVPTGQVSNPIAPCLKCFVEEKHDNDKDSRISFVSSRGMLRTD
jgi:hypothetical protein